MIPDAEARRIACEWHGGGGSALYALCSTGAIDTARPDHDLATEINEASPWSLWAHGDEGDIESLALYVAHHGKRGPVAGWSDMPWGDS